MSRKAKARQKVEKFDENKQVFILVSTFFSACENINFGK